MRAVQAPEPGGSEALQILEIERPEPAAGEVLIRVAAAGLNRADILQAAGFYPPPAGESDTLGLEVSGHIEAIGDGVEGWHPGDRVMALLSGGGYADFVVAPAGQVVAVPERVDLVPAAGFMETFATVWSNVFMTAGLKAGQRLLVHGGSSGIGTTAIALAKQVGAEVFVTVGSERKAQACRDLGADVVIDYRDEDFSAVLKSHGGADVILDIIGAKYLAQNIAALATGGHMVVIGMQGGVKAELNLAALLAKRGSITATSLRARPVAEKAEIVGSLVEHVLPQLATGELAPIIDSTFAFDDVAAAHDYLKASAHIGKVVLLVDPDLR